MSIAKDSINAHGEKASTAVYGFEPPHSTQHDPTKAEALVSDYHDGTVVGIRDENRLKPKIGTKGSIAVAYLIGASWVSLIGTIDSTLAAGGNGCIWWGLIIVCPLSMMSVLSLAEASSLWPVGNPEVWAYHLAPSRWKKLSAYQSGWFLTVGYILLGLACNAVVAQLILAMAQITNPSYTIQKWHTSLVMLCISVMNTFMGIFGSSLLERANTSNFILNVATFIVIFLVLLIETGKKKSFNDAYEAFIYVPNQTGWNNLVIPWLSSLSSVAYATCAYDAPFHFASEMRFPERSAPIAAVGGLALNCLSTIIMAVALIFTSPAESADLVNAPSGSAFTQLMLNKTGSVAGVTVIICSITIPYWIGAVDGNMACARIMWGLSNRGGLPEIFGVVNHKWDAPWFSLIVVTAIQGGLGFINIGSDAAFSAFINAPLLCLGFSYCWVSYWMLVHGRPKLKLKPSFKLGPIFGPACNVVTIVLAVCLAVFLCLPPSYPVTAEGMNYTCVILVFFLGLGPIFWLTYGRKHYRGPVADDASPITYPDEASSEPEKASTDHS